MVCKDHMKFYDFIILEYWQILDILKAQLKKTNLENCEPHWVLMGAFYYCAVLYQRYVLTEILREPSFVAIKRTRSAATKTSLNQS